MKKPIYVEELSPDTPCKLRHFRKIRLFEAFRDKCVLDVGCGTGYFTSHLAATAGRLHAIDIAEANAELTRHNVPAATVTVGDVHDLPCPDAFAECVFCSEVLEHLADPVQGVRQLDRVLKPGGLLLLTFPIRPRLPTSRFLLRVSDRLTAYYYGSDHPQAHQGLLRIEDVSRRLAGMGYSMLRQDRIKNTLVLHVTEIFSISVKLAQLLIRGGRAGGVELADHAAHVNAAVSAVWRWLGLPACRALAIVDALFNGFDSSCAVILARKPDPSEPSAPRPGAERVSVPGQRDPDADGLPAQAASAFSGASQKS